MPPQIRKDMVADANDFIRLVQEPNLFFQGSPAREALLRIHHVEVVQGGDAMART